MNPRFLADGRRFLFTVRGASDVLGIYLGSIDGGATRRIAAGAIAPVIVSDYLLFVRQGTLFAQRFNQGTATLEGNAVVVARDVLFDQGQAVAAVTSDGAQTIAYRTGRVGQRQLLWFDRAGRELGRVGDAESLTLADSNLELSPDGRHLAFTRISDGNQDVWVLDLARSVSSRITSDASVDTQPVWSRPDRKWIAFVSTRSGITDLYRRAPVAGPSEELLLATPFTKGISDWSPDGRYLLYGTGAARPDEGGLWLLPLIGDRRPFRLLPANLSERVGQFSPDGKWVAYQSTQSGRSEIYLHPFRGPGDQIRVSTEGGAQVRWRRDGKELFYLDLDGQLMAVSVATASNGGLDLGRPTLLFSARSNGVVARAGARHDYVVSPDGQRFLIDTVVTPSVIAPITLGLNWQPNP